MNWSDMSGSITEARLIRQGLEAKNKIRDIRNSFILGEKVKISNKDKRKRFSIRGTVIGKTDYAVIIQRTKESKKLYLISFQYTQFLTEELVIN
jgi:uncharacterized protein Veg